MNRENTILRSATEVLQHHLPPGWTVELAREGESAALVANAGSIGITAPDGRTATLLVHPRQRLDPRGALALADEASRAADRSPWLVVAPWMSEATRQQLEQACVGVLDLTGNIRLALTEPGLFIEAVGADHDPSPEQRIATLKGAKAARLVRALCRRAPPLGVRELAAEAQTSPGYVSKLLAMLDREAALSRSEDGKVVAVDLARLLQRWAQDAPLASRARQSSWIEPRGLPVFVDKLRSTEHRHAVTASLAATRRAPIAAPRLGSVYVDDPVAFATALGLRPAEAGANVVLLAPDDDLVFEGRWQQDGIMFAALPQVAADLISGPGRGPAEAEALMQWMTDNPEAWRG